MQFFARLEATCANAVERAFALAFPSAIEPVQIARKLVAAFEAGDAGGRAGRRFIVRLSRSDFERFAADLPYLERQWSAMLARLVERSGRPQRAPDVHAEAGSGVATGTVAIVVETRAEPARLALRVRRGVPLDAAATIERALTVGRDPACDIVLADPRVSRRHLRVAPGAGAPSFEDLQSSNGTRVNGVASAGGPLGLGDVVAIGDSELVVEAAE